MTFALRHGAAAAWLAALLGVAGPSFAAPTLDQQNVVPVDSGSFKSSQSTQQTLGTYEQFAQSFTVGLTGTLVRIDLEVFHGSFTNGSATILLKEMASAGLPGGNTLATWSITNAGSSSTPGSFVSHDLSADEFGVLPGQTYAIVFTWNPPPQMTFSGYSWVGGLSDTYAAGDSFSSRFGVAPTPWGKNVGEGIAFDYGFRTFVDVADVTVPEPSAMLLVSLGFGLLLSSRKAFSTT